MRHARTAFVVFLLVSNASRGQPAYPVDRDREAGRDGALVGVLPARGDEPFNMCQPQAGSILTPSPIPPDSYFGWSLDLSGDRLIVGDPYHDEPLGLIDVGAAYFFERIEGAWHDRGRLVIPNLGTEASLGEATAIDGDWAIASSRFTQGYRGEAFLIRRSAGPTGVQWALAANIKPDPAAANVFFFGYDLDLEGPIAAISALYSSVETNGWVELHELVGESWRKLAHLRPPDGTIFDDFGRSISLSGSRVLVGAPYHPEPTYEGAAYLFHKGDLGWELERKFTPPGLEEFDRAGWQVALDGDTAVVATPYTRTSRPKAWIYRLIGDEWVLEDTIIAPLDNSYAESDFARSIALQGDTLIVGAPYAEIWGAAYMYRRFEGRWALLGRVRFDDVSTDDVFVGDLGRAVSAGGDIAIASAPYSTVQESGGTRTGLVLPIDVGGPVFAITRQPVSVAGTIGDAVEFHAEAIGPGALSHRWYKGETEMADDARISGTATTTLRIEDLVIEDSALYRLRAVSPECGFIESEPALLDMGNCIELITAPDAQVIEAGAPLTLTVEARGILPLNYRWTRSAVDLVDDGRIVGSNTNTLTINPTLPEDQAVYQLIISSQCGEVFSNKAVVSFALCTTITEEPQDVYTFVGNTLTLHAGATSHQPLTYQWWRNGSVLIDGGRLSGATAPTLVITDSLIFDAGEYRCAISCGFNARSTREALVVLNPAGCLGDANNDRRVDMVDLSAVLQMWGYDYRPMTGAGDTDRDGVVGFGDLTMVLSRYGSACP